MTSINKGRDNIYLNVTINDQFGPQTTLYNDQAEYNSTNTVPILSKASDYYCSVVRFDIPLSTIPIFIMPIVPNQGNPNLTQLKVGMSVSGVNTFEQLIYVPGSNQYLPPIQNLEFQVVDVYYFCYSYQSLITIINTGLSQVYISSGLAAAHPTRIAPYLFLNKSQGLISLIVPDFFVKTLSNPNPPTIYMNDALSNYLDAYKLFYNGVNNVDGNDEYFVFDDISNPYFINSIPIAVPEYYEYKQEYSVLGLWSSLRKIFITSNTIPIAYEYSNSGYINDTLTPILTDFVPIIDNAGQSRSIAYYQPSSQYRLIDLISDMPLQKIDLKIFWESVNGNVFPLIISQYQQVNIKLAFLKKSLYNPKSLLEK
jgi:hypothetical protein